MKLELLFMPILLPIVFGLLCLVIPKKIKGVREGFALIASLITLVTCMVLFLRVPLTWLKESDVILRLDNLSGFILLAIGLFGVLVILYSIKFMQGKSRLNEYYAYLLWTIGAAAGAILANNLVLFLAFWGFLGLTLYFLIGIGGAGASPAAKKSFIIVGGSDTLILLGIGIIWFLTKTLEMHEVNLSLSGGLPIAAFICLAIGAFAKAGAMPFHTWIPDSAEKAPVPVVAFLPASLDKLLGIYLLARICLNLFILNRAMGVVLMVIGSLTIILAVMMALVQHDLKRLLGYHAVSQVGYMVLGIGTGNPIGIAGGLFHMLNHAIYKGCLFMTGGAVEDRTGTTELDKLGGLAKAMPITFITCLIASLSISGVPPFNGFVSKWMVYQGIIELGRGGDRLWIIWLVAAMFGSALTLASFMKLIHATFLGQSSTVNREPSTKTNEVNFTMWLPMVVLAGLCIIFGVFAYSVPLKLFILPCLPKVSFLGFWKPALATLLIIVGIGLGAIIYLVGKVRPFREDAAYIGGEVVGQEMRVSGVDFYQTIRDFGFFRWMYRKAEEKQFDIYDQGRDLVFYFTRTLRRTHTGILPTYLSWTLVGFVVLLFILMR